MSSLDDDLDDALEDLVECIRCESGDADLAGPYCPACGRPATLDD